MAGCPLLSFPELEAPAGMPVAYSSASPSPYLFHPSTKEAP